MCCIWCAGISPLSDDVLQMMPGFSVSESCCQRVTSIWTLCYLLCRNMDIVGVSGVAAEAELLAAIALFLERVGLSAQDIVIKVSSRKVLQAILERFGVPDSAVGPVSVIVDKMEKIPLEKVSPTFRWALRRLSVPELA